MLNTSDKIQVISIVTTTFISLVSIGIAISTLKQNNKMIEESTRPYVVVYASITNFQQPLYRLIVKNFGKSGATITSFDTNHDLINFTFADDTRRPFENLKNTFIAPGQSFVSTVDYKKMLEQNIKIINFKIRYTFENKIYNESIDLNILSALGLLSPRAATSDKELKIISYTLQELVDKNL